MSESTASEPILVERGGGRMPDWGVAELPEPPRLRGGWTKLLGPGLMMAGAAIGGGEWLMGPATTGRYGGIIMWLAMVSILTQVAYNLEVMRYALFCGESIFVGWFRLLPGPKFWTCVYLFVDFFGLWPYLAANAAGPLTAAIIGHVPAALPTSYEADLAALSARTGVAITVLEDMKANPLTYASPAAIAADGDRLKDMEAKAAAASGQEKTNLTAQIETAKTSVRKPIPGPLLEHMQGEAKLRTWLGYGIFVACFIPLIFGGKIYNVLVRIMVVKVIFVLGYLLFLAFFFVAPSIWAEIFGGFVFLGKDAAGDWGFRFLPDTTGGPPIDWALLGAFAAIAGQGGMNNSQFSSYGRDRGWGMGKAVGAIPSLVGGREVKLQHTGKRFVITPDSLRRFKGWMRVAYRDQWMVWFVGCVLGVAIPAMISLHFIGRSNLTGDAIATATAEAITRQTGMTIYWSLTLLCGFMVLAPNQITAADGLIRRWTESLWVGSKKLSHLEGGKVRYVYFTMLIAYLIWGLIILVWTGDKPLTIVKAAGVIMNFALGFTAIHTLAVNTILLPKEVRPGIIAKFGLIACGIFFIIVASLGVVPTLKDLGVMAK